MKCINCDKKIKSNDTYCSNCGINLKNIEVINDYKKKKSNIVFYLIILFLLLIGISISAWLLLNNNDSKKNNKNIIVNDDEILINNYILKVPEGFEKNEDSKNSYITNDELTIIYKTYPLSIDDIKNNKEIINDSIKEQGYIIESYSIKKIDNIEFYLINAKLHGGDYCLAFYELDDENSLYLIITSNYLSQNNDSWIKNALTLIKSIKKI